MNQTEILAQAEKCGACIASGYAEDLILTAGDVIFSRENFAAFAAELTGSVPDGWKLVPIEPTAEMTNAGYTTDPDGSKWMQRPYESWRDMVVAAPPAPVEAPAVALPAEPMDWPLPCDVRVGHGIMRKGVPLRTLVTRMKVLYEMATGRDCDQVENQRAEQKPFVPCTCFDETAKRLCLKKRECIRVEAQSAAAPAAQAERPAVDTSAWPMCNPGCDPEFGGEKSRHCSCEPAKRAMAEAQAERPGPFPYQRTFNAIAAATEVCAGNVAISVIKFREAFGPTSEPAKPEEQPVYEEWLARVRPSGDVDAVQEQWLASSDYADWRDGQLPAEPVPPAFYVSGQQLPLLGKTKSTYIAYRMEREGNFDTAVYFTAQEPAEPAAPPVTDEEVDAALPLAYAPQGHYHQSARDRMRRALEDFAKSRAMAAPAKAEPVKPPMVWPKAQRVGRREDMSPTGKLEVMFDNDNDVIVAVSKGETAADWESACVEFCNPGGGGGGRSSRTRMALIALMVAIEADNAEYPHKDALAAKGQA